MALMLLHEWELPREPEEDPDRRDPFEWREWRWAFLAGALAVAGLLTGDLLQLVFLWFAMMVVARHVWIDIYGDRAGGLSEYQQ
jgi:hypothetical protein